MLARRGKCSCVVLRECLIGLSLPLCFIKHTWLSVINTYEAAEADLLIITFDCFMAMAQIPLGSTRLDTFDFVEQVETSRALPTWRTTNDLVQV